MEQQEGNDSESDFFMDTDSDNEQEQRAPAPGIGSSSSSSSSAGPSVAQYLPYFQRRKMNHSSDTGRQKTFENAINAMRRRRLEQARATTQKRWDTFGNLSREEQQAYMNKHRGYMTVNVSDADAERRYNMAMENQPLIPKRVKRDSDEPLSYDQRQALLAQRKAQFNQSLQQAYPDITDERDRELLYARGRKLARQRMKKSHKLTDEEKALARERRDYRQIFPNAVLKGEDVEEELREFDGDDFTDYVNPGWRGLYPQTMPHEDREKAARTFAELTGTLGWMPTYDPKLTTVESAAKVYNSEDYDIKAYDMDMNDFTPANVIVRKKTFMKDAKGNFIRDPQTHKRVPAPETEWTTIAANGYRLQDPNQNQQYARLKTMAYYKSHPTSSKRKDEPMGLYIQNSPVYAPKAKNAMAAVKKYVRAIILGRADNFRKSLNIPKAPYLINLLM